MLGNEFWQKHWSMKNLEINLSLNECKYVRKKSANELGNMWK